MRYSEGRFGLMLFVVLAAILIVFRYYWPVSEWLVPTGSVPPAKAISDRIAILAALFSALAFAGLLYTILLQRRQLALQRSDQADFAVQLTDQQDHLRAQTKLLLQQTFENTFFHLLRLHNDNVRSQKIHSATNVTLEGRAAFEESARLLRRALISRSSDSKVISLAEVNEVYSNVCEMDGVDYSHYFRNLYHIVKYVHEDGKDGDRQRYLSQLRAQLSQAEFVLLLANGLRDEGHSKFKPLIERYSLLHQLRLDDAISKIQHYYDARAFGS